MGSLRQQDFSDGVFTLSFPPGTCIARRTSATDGAVRSFFHDEMNDLDGIFNGMGGMAGKCGAIEREIDEERWAGGGAGWLEYLLDGDWMHGDGFGRG